MANEWDVAVPPNTELVSDLPAEHRQMKTNTKAVMEKEHAALGTGNTGGEHKQGSAVMWHLPTASIPALQPDGTALASTDNGRLWHDTTTDIVYVLEDYSDPAIGTGWIAIGHYLGDIAINTDKFTVARATGNTVIAGTLGVTGVATVAKGSLSASTDAPTTDAMLANKKYIDDQITAMLAASVSVGATTTVDDDEATMLAAHAYLCNQDGAVEVVITEGNSASLEVICYDDTDSNPASGGNIRARYKTIAYGQTGAIKTLSFKMASGRYFEVTASNATVAIRWVPSGTLVKCTDQD